MATSYTTLLGLALPATGELSGTWGDTVNNYISNYIDAAVAGAQTVTTDTTLTKTTGSSLGATSSQYAIIIASPASANITITAPAASKIYTIINTSGTYTVKICGAGPTTGVTLGVNEKAQVAWNGSDFVRIGASGGPGVFSSITNTGLTSGRVVYSTTNGLETDSANLLFNGTTLTANTLNLTNALGTTYGGTGLTSFTANGVVYASSSSVLATGSALTFDGSQVFSVGTTGGTVKAVGTSGITTLTADTGSNNIQVQSRPDISFSRLISSAYLLDIATSANQPISFTVNNSEQMRLTSTGLGIGTSSPSVKLDVSGAASINSESRFVAKLADTSAVAQGNGGGIVFRGVYTGTTLVDAAGVQAYKANATDNNYSYGLAFVTRADGGNLTANMRLDASGNLGLGVTPSAWGTASSRRAIELPGGGSIWGQNFGGSNPSMQVYSNAYESSTGPKYTNSSQASGYQQNAGIHAWFTAPSGTAGNAITFTQAMTLDASGNLLINTTSVLSPNRKLQIDSGSGVAALFKQSNAATNECVDFWNNATTGNNVFVEFQTEATSTARGTISFNRAAVLISYNTTSDYRAKDIIGPVQDSGATIDALKIYEGKMKGATQSRPMLVAHEAQAITPYAVTGEKDAVKEDGTPDYQQMDVSSLVPLLIAEIQSLRIRIAQLENKP
jgi:hypothetical protein